jgi:hypothetical protein
MSRIFALVEAAKSAGFGGYFADSVTLSQRASDLDAQMSALRGGAESAWSKTVRDLAAGTAVEPADVAATAARYGAWGHDGPAAMAFVQAAASLRRSADESVVAAVPRLWQAMVAEVSDVVAQSVKVARDLPASVRTAGDVVRARDSGVGHRWADLGMLFGRWRQVHDLDEQMRVDGWIPKYKTTREDQYAAWLRFEHPERLPAGFGGLAPELQLAAAYVAGAGPGLFDAATAMRRRRDWNPGDMTAAEAMRQSSPLPQAPAPEVVVEVPGWQPPPVARASIAVAGPRG